MARVYIQVVAEHFINGTTRPLSIKWEDGHIFTVDRLLDVRMGPSPKGAGHGMRCTCRIRNKEVYLFFDGLEGKWFIEK